MHSLSCISSFFRRGGKTCLIDDVYCASYQRRLCADPFTPHRLCLYAEVLHRATPDSPLFAYFFDSDGILLAQLPLHSKRSGELCKHYPAILETAAKTNAQMLAFSISGTYTDKRAALAEQLMLFCQTNHLTLMEIAVYREPVFYPFLETHIQK